MKKDFSVSACLTFFHALLRTSLNVLAGVLSCSQVAVAALLSVTGIFSDASACRRWTPVSLTWCACWSFVAGIPPPSRDFTLLQRQRLLYPLRNSDFMLGVRLVTDAALSFQAPFFFFFFFLKALMEPFSVTPLSFCSLVIFIKTFGGSEYMWHVIRLVWVQD